MARRTTAAAKRQVARKFTRPLEAQMRAFENACRRGEFEFTDPLTRAQGDRIIALLQQLARRSPMVAARALDPQLPSRET